MSSITITTSPLPTPSLLALLTSHLPHSLSVLRRLQFAANFPQTNTSHTCILHASYRPSSPKSRHFAVAYLDLSRSPETESWLYCTLEDASLSADHTSVQVNLPEDDVRACDELVLALLRRMRSLEGSMGGTERVVGRGRMVLGGLEEGVRRRLLARGVRVVKTPAVADGVDWEFCGKWLFRVEELGVTGEEMEGAQGGMWDVVRREDVRVVQGRTSIPRQEATLLSLPSTVVRLEDGTPIAWAFLGLDGTLMTLHVEEPYRGKGLAKALACRLMRDHLGDYGDDGWGAADVFVSNLKSQAVCRSIGGKVVKTVSWAIIELQTVGDPM